MSEEIELKAKIRDILERLGMRLIIEIFITSNKNLQTKLIKQIQGRTSEEILDKFKTMKIKLSIIGQESILEEIYREFDSNEIVELKYLLSLPIINRFLACVRDYMFHLINNPNQLSEFVDYTSKLKQTESSITKIIAELSEIGIYTDQEFTEHEDKELNKALLSVTNNSTVQKFYDVFRRIKSNYFVVFRRFIDSETIKYIFGDQTILH